MRPTPLPHSTTPSPTSPRPPSLNLHHYNALPTQFPVAVLLKPPLVCALSAPERLAPSLPFYIGSAVPANAPSLSQAAPTQTPQAKRRRVSEKSKMPGRSSPSSGAKTEAAAQIPSNRSSGAKTEAPHQVRNQPPSTRSEL